MDFVQNFFSDFLRTGFEQLIVFYYSLAEVMSQVNVTQPTFRVFVSTGAIYNAWDHHGRESTVIRATVSCQELKLDGILVVFQMAF